MLWPTELKRHKFLSTPSARRATSATAHHGKQRFISIHALREEGDLGTIHAGIQCFDFYPRPPRGGRPTRAHTRTRPADFYPRPPRGGRLLPFALVFFWRIISIHALREEGDPLGQYVELQLLAISIHALREEGDAGSHFGAREGIYFYPRPPRGGRPGPLKTWTPSWKFLSTPSARRATWPPVSTSSMYSNFYPRPPRGGRRMLWPTELKRHKFLSTPSARRATRLL